MSRFHLALAAALLTGGLARAESNSSALSALVGAQGSAQKTDAAVGALPPGDEALVKEFDALSSAFNKAQTEYFEPYTKAKTDEEREKVQLDPALQPTKLFIPKFEELAKRADGTDVGLNCCLWIVKHASGGKSKEVTNAVDALSNRYIQSPKLVEFATYLRYASWSLGQELAQRTLQHLISDSPHDAVRAQAMCSLAYALLDDPAGDTESAHKRAHDLFVKVQSDFPDSKAAKQAGSGLFELEHLQIGMTVPEIEGTDVEGAPFKLSEYRGKVVVLDFWGNW